MLVDLRVKNFALIDQLEINFQQGLNVLTGETGAGKSIIIGALDILLGARAYTDVIRQGKEKAFIEAAFEPEFLDEINRRLEESGIQPEPDILLLSREINLNGRNRNRINGQLATVSMIRDISRLLVDIHGQHEHQSLLDPGLHLGLVDDFIGQEAAELKTEVGRLYQKLAELDNRLEELQIDEGEKARRLDMLDFQIKEIEDASLEETDYDELKHRYRKLSNMEEIFQTTGHIYSQINGENFDSTGLLDRAGNIMKDLEQIKEFDPRLEEFYQQASEVFYSLESLGFQLEDYNQSLEFDQGELMRIEERLDLINNLKKKYGETIEEILEYKQEMEQERDNLLSQEQRIEELERQKEELNEKYYRYAEQLSELRREYAQKLEREIKGEFADLAMKDTRIKVSFERKQPAADGIDDVEFMISTNPGEGLKPLAKIASGGELSRIMLALKTITAEIDRVETLVFDEVDSGVGGKTAQRMAEKLATIAGRRQVICITHLPQIASMSDQHFYIDKNTSGERTYTSIQFLEREGQRQELARMLAGANKTSTALRHAEEMLQMAEDKKASFDD